MYQQAYINSNQEENSTRICWNVLFKFSSKAEALKTFGTKACNCTWYKLHLSNYCIIIWMKEYFFWGSMKNSLLCENKEAESSSCAGEVKRAQCEGQREGESVMSYPPANSRDQPLLTDYRCGIIYPTFPICSECTWQFVAHFLPPPSRLQ